MAAKRSARGFTLIELLVVCAIIALLLSILVPVLWQIRSFVDAARCGNNMGQLARAMHLYSNAYNGCLPGNAYDKLPNGKSASWLEILKGDPGGTWDIKNQKIAGSLSKYVEPNVYQCPVYRSQTEIGGDQVLCHYAMPSIYAGMPTGVCAQGFYYSPYTSRTDGSKKWLRGAPILVEPLVRDNGSSPPSPLPSGIENSLGVWDSSTSGSTAGKWTTLPNGAFAGAAKLATRRHLTTTNVAFMDAHVDALSFADTDTEITASDIFIVVDASAQNKIHLGHKGAWKTDGTAGTVNWLDCPTDLP